MEKLYKSENPENEEIQADFPETQLPQIMDVLDMELQYKKIMYIYEAAIQQITAKLNILKGEFQFSNDRNPISSISSRVKSRESILYKMNKLGLPKSIHLMVQNIQDVAGIRVICPFIEDVYSVARMLVRQKDIQVVEVKDYIRSPKPNGYRSFHLIITTEVNFAETTYKVPAEIQIRTIAMDFWASTEHQLRYKKDREFTEDAHKKLKHCADIMAEADELMQEIIGDFCEEQW